jgi:hypothetical protein
LDYFLCLWVITSICYFRLSFDGLGAGGFEPADSLGKYPATADTTGMVATCCGLSSSADNFEQQILKTSEANIGTIIEAYA